MDPRQAARIAQALEAGPDDCVLEIGAGLGALTLPLAERAGAVVAIERDTALAAALARLARGLDRVRVVAADALRMPFPDLGVLARAASGGAGARCLVAGNLPYGITSPLLMWLAAEPGWNRAVVMVQKEVADRLAAPPGSAAYGSLTVAVAARCRVRRLFDVSRRCFYPPPEVDSTVVTLEPLPERPDAVLSRALEAVLRAAFGQRRKTLRNALRTLTGDAASVAELLRRAGVDGELRAEALDVARFLELARAWQALEKARPPGGGVL